MRLPFDPFPAARQHHDEGHPCAEPNRPLQCEDHSRLLVLFLAVMERSRESTPPIQLPLRFSAATPLHKQEENSGGRNPNHRLHQSYVHWFVLFALVDLLHHREQVLKDLQNAGPSRDDQHRRQNEKEYWKYQLHADFSGALLSLLPAPGAQEIGMGSQ